MEQLDVAERDDHIEVVSAPGPHLDQRRCVHTGGRPDGVDADATEPGVMQRRRHVRVLDVVDRDPPRTPRREHGIERGEQLHHDPRRLMCARLDGETVGGDEPDAIDRSNTHQADAVATLDGDHTAEPIGLQLGQRVPACRRIQERQRHQQPTINGRPMLTRQQFGRRIDHLVSERHRFHTQDVDRPTAS